MKTKEIIFIVNESLDGGFEAKAVGFPIFSIKQKLKTN